MLCDPPGDTLTHLELDIADMLDKTSRNFDIQTLILPIHQNQGAAGRSRDSHRRIDNQIQRLLGIEGGGNRMEQLIQQIEPAVGFGGEEFFGDWDFVHVKLRCPGGGKRIRHGEASGSSWPKFFKSLPVIVWPAPKTGQLPLGFDFINYLK